MAPTPGTMAPTPGVMAPTTGTMAPTPGTMAPTPGIKRPRNRTKATKRHKGNENIQRQRKLLNSFQSERFSNVKEYIQTTMKMGEFINAMRSYKIADTVSNQSDGSKSMKSIKPELGTGLGLKSNKHRGKTFPKFNIKKYKSFDDIFSTEPVLIVSDNLNVRKLKSKIKIIKEGSHKELSKILKKFQVEAIIIRPDRFILQTFNSRENFIKNINKTLQGII